LIKIGIRPTSRPHCATSRVRLLLQETINDIFRIDEECRRRPVCTMQSTQRMSEPTEPTALAITTLRSRSSCARALAMHPLNLSATAAIVVCAFSITPFVTVGLGAWWLAVWYASGSTRIQRAIHRDRARSERDARRSSREERCERAQVSRDRLRAATAAVDAIQPITPHEAGELEDLLDRFADLSITLERCRRHATSAATRLLRPRLDAISRRRPDSPLRRVLAARLQQADVCRAQIATLEETLETLVELFRMLAEHTAMDATSTNHAITDELYARLDAALEIEIEIDPVDESCPTTVSVAADVG
jgi:hypothetical protein